MTPNSPNNNDRPSFMDRGTILAFILILGFWFAWSKYMEVNYPTKPNAPVASTVDGAKAPGTNGSPALPSEAKVAADAKESIGKTEPSGPASQQETFVDYSDARWAFQISSKGMGLKNIDVKDYRTRAGREIALANITGDYPFATSLVGTPGALDFKIEHPSADTFIGRATSGDLQIEKTMKVDSAKYTIDTTVTVTHAGANFQGVETALADKIAEPVVGGMMATLSSIGQAPDEKNGGGASSYDHQDWFVRYEGTKKRSTINKAKGVEFEQKNVSIAALTEHYFALAVIDHSDLTPNFVSNVQAGAERAVGHLVYQPVNKTDTFTQKFTAFAGPKSFNLLASIDENLTLLIDYGMFSFLAKPILLLLKFLFSIIGNWGFAIIALTIIVRMIVMPFNVFSYKSMKVMQRIQPEMNRIRERYKDKPPEQKIQMNQEIMELMKRNKANPLGGCIPMLIQLPVFIALYAVLGQSIELYRAPFGLWIHDLSVRDPFLVLPILMGLTMFVNQKITPSQMDPQQAKIMLFMPVIFSLFMLSLPSGLTLYIFISTLFGIIQQMIFLRDKGAVTSIKTAKA